jgi:primosomal protein N' (replication factor Y) (superfamily II helicase)
VLPDVPAVDRSFDYTLPAELAPDVEIGTLVRVGLHGRRVRGWVMELDATPAVDAGRLRAVLAVVGAGPPDDLVALSAFGAWRWAGPRAAFLRAASAPNRVAPSVIGELDIAIFPAVGAPVALPDARVRLVVCPPGGGRVDLVRALLEPTGSTIVLVPDASEGSAIGRELADDGRSVIVLRSDQTAAARTAAWVEARRGACVVVGTRVAVLAPVPDLAGIVVVDDADEALAEERAPAWHARELAHERARRATARLSLLTPAPTAEALELAGAACADAGGGRRAWPRLEIVDLRDEPPGVGLLSSALGPALHRAIEAGGRALCVLNRRGRAQLLVCRSCGSVARCLRCDARVAEGEGTRQCARCGLEQPGPCPTCGAGVFRKLRPGVTGLRDVVAGLVPHHRVIAVDAASAPLPPYDVAVGTEAVLHRARATSVPVRTVAFLDFDQELLAPRIRASEQALWLLVRAARLLGTAEAGGVLLVQTRLPGDVVLRAVASGETLPVAEAERARRRDLGLPPFGGLAEVRGDPGAVADACARLDGLVTVVGPTAGRALLRAPSSAELCDALAATDLGPARALGRLRIDVDPLRV